MATVAWHYKYDLIESSTWPQILTHSSEKWCNTTIVVSSTVLFGGESWMKVSEWIRAYSEYFYTNYLNLCCTKTLSLGALSNFNSSGYEFSGHFWGVFRIFSLPFFIVLGLKWTFLKVNVRARTSRKLNDHVTWFMYLKVGLYCTVIFSFNWSSRIDFPGWNRSLPKLTDVSKWTIRMFKIRQFKNTEVSFLENQVDRSLQSWPSETDIWPYQKFIWPEVWK